VEFGNAFLEFQVEVHVTYGPPSGCQSHGSAAKGRQNGPLVLATCTNDPQIIQSDSPC